MITTPATLIHKYDSPSGNVSFVIFQPEHIFSFMEGQFCMIEATFGDTMIKQTKKKPYSIATTYKQLQDYKHIGFIVKKSSENGMSDFLTQKINIGDTVTLKGPVGHYCDPHNHPNYLLVSIGSGLSPNFGIFQHLAFESEKNVNIITIFGEKNEQEHIPYVIEHFKKYSPQNIHTYFGLSQQKNTLDEYFYGRVQTKIPEAIQRVGKQTTCFICGSPQGVQECVDLLLTLGINKEDIITEKR